MRDSKHHESHVIALTEVNRVHCCHSSKQDQDRQQQLARQRLVTWQRKDQSELDKVKEELKNLETETKPVPVSSDNIGALQVCAATNDAEGFDFVAVDWQREDESNSGNMYIDHVYGNVSRAYVT